MDCTSEILEIIQFISGIVLGRLLTPYDYGCIGMLSIFLVLAEAFIDGGFGSALIQKKNPTQVDYSFRQEELAVSMELDKMLWDTHEGNVHRLAIAKKTGYKFVDFKFYNDHYNVVMVKWLNGCPFSSLRCKYEFIKRRFIVKAKHSLKALFT